MRKCVRLSMCGSTTNREWAMTGDVTVVAVAVVVMHDRIMTTFTGAMCVCGFVYIPDVEHECE